MNWSQVTLRYWLSIQDYRLWTANKYQIIMVSRSTDDVSLKGYEKVQSPWSYIHTHARMHTVSHKNRILYFGSRVYIISNTVSSNNRRSIIQRRSLSTNWVKSHVPWSYHLPRCYLNQYLDPEKKGVAILCHFQMWFHFDFIITSTRLLLTAEILHSKWY